MKWKTTNPTKKKIMNDMNNTPIELIVVSISALINYLYLAIVYKVIVKDMRITGRGKAEMAGIYIVCNAVYIIVSIMAITAILIKDDFTK